MAAMAITSPSPPNKISISRSRIHSELTNNNEQRYKPAITISTNPSHVNINTLSHLYLSCHHSPHRFPSATADGVDTRKLAVAVAHSAVVVSVFAAADRGAGRREKGLLGMVVPVPVRVSPESGELVSEQKNHGKTTRIIFNGGQDMVEICLISARELPRSSLLKYQWYAIGWTDLSNKYCTKIDASGNATPVWKTKFTTVVDTAVSDYQELALNVEVYSREPLFLREKLQGTATILLREFLVKYRKSSDNAKKGAEDVGSFQLRKRNSNKPQGFIDISVKISEEKDGSTSSCSFLGKEEGFNLQENSSGITCGTGAGPMLDYTERHAEPPFNMPGYPRPPAAQPYAHLVPYPRNYSHPSVGMPSYSTATGPSYPAPQMPPPRLPPPSSNMGYMPTFLPQTNSQSTLYINMPSSGGAGRGAGLGSVFGVSLGAGALPAGAMLYSDDVMSGFELQTKMRDPSLIMSIDSPF